MKKPLKILFCLVMASALFYGCSSPATNPSADPTDPTGVGDPPRTPTGVEIFYDLGVYIDVPAGASDVKCTVIDGAICQVEFNMGADSYVYRSANSSEDISGVENTLADTHTQETINASDFERVVDLAGLDGGGWLGLWYDEPFAYSLTTTASIEKEDFVALVFDLIEAGPKG